MPLTVDFCGEVLEVLDDSWITVGRSGDIAIDDNPYLHRHFLRVGGEGGFWWLVNIGGQIAATVSDADAMVQAWLAPSARLPLVFPHTVVRFTAGPTTYAFDIYMDDAPFSPTASTDEDEGGETTIGPPAFTADQKALIVALAEPVLRHDDRSPASIPSSSDAARTLGWTTTKFNRKLDNVCQKLDKIGVPGLHGAPGELASTRRARLVEYAVASRLITRADLSLLASNNNDDASG